MLGRAQVIAGLPEQFKTGNTLGKIAEPEDVVAAVMSLPSDQTGHVTVGYLYVGGGATQRA